MAGACSALTRQEIEAAVADGVRSGHELARRLAKKHGLDPAAF